MTHGPEHHIEHAEHATHASHDPFDRRVTISIAMVAAVLACVTMLGHRAHNETLLLQTEGGINFAKGADTWGQYQAQKIRGHVNSQILRFSDSVPVKEGAVKEREEARKDWKADVERYASQTAKLKKEAEEFVARGAEDSAKSQEAHHRAERFDLGELGLQLGVVLCSLAILTKGKPFWYLGLAASLAGVAVALSSFIPAHQ